MQAHKASFDAQEGKIGVQSLALSPYEKTLASVGADGLVKLWETTRPSNAIADRRFIVRQATQAVDERYQQSRSQRAVLGSLSRDDSLSKEVLAAAAEIASSRGDRPRAPQSDWPRHSFVFSPPHNAI